MAEERRIAELEAFSGWILVTNEKWFCYAQTRRQAIEALRDNKGKHHDFTHYRAPSGRVVKL